MFNGFIEVEGILEGFQIISKGKIMVLLVVKAYGGFTMKTGKNREKW